MSKVLIAFDPSLSLFFGISSLDDRVKEAKSLSVFRQNMLFHPKPKSFKKKLFCYRVFSSKLSPPEKSEGAKRLKPRQRTRSRQMLQRRPTPQRRPSPSKFGTAAKLPLFSDAWHEIINKSINLKILFFEGYILQFTLFLFNLLIFLESCLILPILIFFPVPKRLSPRASPCVDSTTGRNLVCA